MKRTPKTKAQMIDSIIGHLKGQSFLQNKPIDIPDTFFKLAFASKKNVEKIYKTVCMYS